MNTWEYRKLAIVESDDFQDKYDRNGLEMLFYWKAKYPKFKVSLFTIPNKISNEMLNLVGLHSNWIELLVHGFDHDSNFECWGWDYEKTKILVERTLKRDQWINFEDKDTAFKKFFKAPGWTITGGPEGEGSGYPLDEANLLAKDPQAVYKALKDMNFVVMDRHYNRSLRPEGLEVICIDCQDSVIHMHTWDMVTGDLAGKNGFRQVEELHGVPWDQDTEFKFVSEAWEEGLFKPCQNP